MRYKVPKKKPKPKTTWPVARPKAKQPALVKYVADRARDYIANRIREKDLAEVWRKLKVTTPTARSVKIVGPGGTVEFRMGQETVFLNGPGQATWDFYMEDAGLVREEGGKDSLNRPDIAGEFVEEYMKEALFTAIDGTTGASRDDLYPHLKGRIKAKKPWWKVW
jgi:hypothetical protein